MKLNRKMAGSLLLQVRDFENYVKWKSFPENALRESVLFYTFHKCASTLFSGYLLKKIDGLRHVDYARQIYRRKAWDKVTFSRYGFVYGPIRVSAPICTQEFEKLVAPASDLQFIKGKRAIFLIRDPRDVLVSAYYSVGYSHGFSPVREIRERQEKNRSLAQSQSLDEFVMEKSDLVFGHFETVARLNGTCEQSVVLKYEDMIDNWEYFVSGLTTYLDISQSVLDQLYKKSRPRSREDTSSHRRSGKAGGFRESLKSETVATLNLKLASVLERFGYEE